MARNRISRCCCDIVCVLFEDDFERSDDTDIGSDWSELTEDWSINGGKLYIDAVDAVAECLTASSSDAMAIVVDVYAPSAGDKVRGCVRLTDSDNYLCAELEFNGSTTLRIFERSSGSDGSAIDSDSSSAISNGDEVQLVVCVEGTIFSAVAHDVYGARVLSVTGTVSSSFETSAGLATGDTLSSSATFNDFMLMTKSDSCQGCERCIPLPYTEDFSGSTIPWFYFTDTGWSLTGGRLEYVASSSSSTIIQCFTAPSGDYLMDCYVYNEDSVYFGGRSAIGFYAGDAITPPVSTVRLEAFWKRNMTAGYYKWITPGGNGTVSQEPVTGDKLSILVDVGSGDIIFKVNDIAIYTKSETISLGSAFTVTIEATGDILFSTIPTLAFDNYSVADA